MLDVIYRITFVQAKFPKAIVFLSAHNYILRMKKAKIWKHVKCLVCDHHFFLHKVYYAFSNKRISPCGKWVMLFSAVKWPRH